MITASLLSVNLAERAAAESSVPRAYTTIGFVAGLLGADRLARSYFSRARAGASHDASELAYALTVEGVYDSGLGRWSAAEASITRAVQILDGVHDPVVAELTMTAYGHVEFYSGRVLEAERRFEQLLAAARARESEQHETWAQFSIARSLIARGCHADALPLLEAARDALARRPELQSEIICHGLLAAVYAQLGDATLARVAADGTAQRIRRASPTGFPALEGYRGAIDAYLSVSEPRAARGVVRALAALARVFPIAHASLELYRGKLARTRAGARRHFERALEHARTRGLPREESEAQRALSQLQSQGVLG
jgi:tetratricopeptide (TPR) repeat protein